MDHRVKPGDDDLSWYDGLRRNDEKFVAPSWLTDSASKPENVSGLAPWFLKFDAY
jgi:hypothetical protein